MGATYFQLRLSLFVVIAILSANVSFASTEVTGELKATVDKAISIVTDKKYKDDKKSRRKALREVIDSRFSYEQMAMRSLAQDWNDRTLEEKKHFVELFSKLLESTYASRIESYRDEKINFIDEDITGNHALVRSQIERKNGNIAVDYKLVNINGKWLIYDFVIEGVSMIRNYRTQFVSILQKESYAGLVKMLAAKAEEIEPATDDTKPSAP